MEDTHTTSLTHKQNLHPLPSDFTYHCECQLLALLPQTVCGANNRNKVQDRLASSPSKYGYGLPMLPLHTLSTSSQHELTPTTEGEHINGLSLPHPFLLTDNMSSLSLAPVFGYRLYCSLPTKCLRSIFAEVRPCPIGCCRYCARGASSDADQCFSRTRVPAL